MHEYKELHGISQESIFETATNMDTDTGSDTDAGAGTVPAPPDEKTSYWHAHFENWENSGLSQAEYCRRQNLKYCLFHYWKRKLRKPSQPSGQRNSDSVPIKLVEVGSGSPLGFGPSLSLGTAPGDFFRLWIGGICVEVGNKFNPQSLSHLLRCLRTL